MDRNHNLRVSRMLVNWPWCDGGRLPVIFHQPDQPTLPDADASGYGIVADFLS
jgi:hypothetical protein